jgi:hypothetical protein
LIDQDASALEHTLGGNKAAARAAVTGAAVMRTKRQETRVEMAVSARCIILSVHSETVSVTLNLDSLRARYDACGAISSLKSTLHQITCGVENQGDLVQLGSRDQPIRVDVDWDATEHSTVTRGDLGLCTVYLHENVLAPAIGFLYDPYRRIVLPSYGVSELMTIDEDTIINRRVILSSRKRIYVTNARFNHLELDLCGNELHLVPSSSALLVLDAAVTLVLYNCTVFLYDQAFEQCVATGNGGCIVLDDSVRIEHIRPEPSGLVLAADESTSRNTLELSFALDASLPDASGHRALNLRAEAVLQQRNTCIDGDVRSSLTFKLENLEAACLYYADATSEVPTDFSSLIAPWSMILRTETENTPKPITRVNIAAERGVDVRLRVGDAILVIEALKQASSAFGHIKTNVPGAAATGTDELGIDQKLIAAEAEAEAASVTTVTINLKQVGVYFVDDSGTSLDQPLLYFTMFNVVAPTLEITQRTTTIHLQLQIQSEFYDLEAGGWRPFIERVELDVVHKNVKALTLHDLAHRRGQQKIGLRVRPLHIHVTPMIIQVVQRALDLTNVIQEAAASKVSPSGQSGIQNAASQSTMSAVPMATPLAGGSRSQRGTAGMHRTGRVRSASHQRSSSQQFNHTQSLTSVTVSAAASPLLAPPLRPHTNGSSGSGHSADPEGHVSSQSFNLGVPTFQPTPNAAANNPGTPPALPQRLSYPSTPAMLPQGSTSAMFPSPGGTVAPAPKAHFAQYVISQHLGFPVEVSFAESDFAKFPDTFVLPSGASAAFNFPRIEGKELSVSQHRVIVTSAEGSVPLFIGRTGCHLAAFVPSRTSANEGNAHMDFRFVVDVALKHGQKIVVLRSNVTFTNALPFPVHLSGVGELAPNSDSTSVPASSMRSRCVISPRADIPCEPVCFGLQYVGLAFLFDQMFLCAAKVQSQPAADASSSRLGDGAASAASQRKPSSRRPPPMIPRQSLQEAVYFIAKFSKEMRPLSAVEHVTDVRCTLEPPFSIANFTGAPLTIGLYLQRNVPAKKTALLSHPAGVSFSHIATLPVDESTILPITQVDPLADVYLDVVVVQPTGEVVKRTTGDPILIRSRHAKSRGNILIIRDQFSQPLVLRVEYDYQRIIISCGYWVVNSTMHYLQIGEPKRLQSTHRSAGQTSEGIAPSAGLPFLMCTQGQLEDAKKSNAQAVIRVGRHRSDGAVEWTDWSEPFSIDRVQNGTVDCKANSSCAVSVALSVSYVGGIVKDTLVLQFSPRWIVMNRCSRDMVLKLSAKDPSFPDKLTAGQSRTIDYALRRGSNTMRLQYAEADDVCACETSEPICIDGLIESGLNMRYAVASDRSRVLFDVIRISVYRRNGVLFIAVDPVKKAPHIIENRTRLVCYVKQAGSQRELIVYPRTSKGFVWDSESLPHKVSLSVSENGQMAKCVVNLDPTVLTVSDRHVRQVIVMPVSGLTLFVRVRSSHGSFAISVTHDTTIDAMLVQPFHQKALRLHIDTVFLLVSDYRQDLALLSIASVDAAFSQGRSAETESDMQLADIRIGQIQIDDERKNAQQKYVFYSVPREIHSFVMLRQMDRTNPILNLRRFEMTLRPLWVHLEDTFLYDILRFVDRVAVMSAKNVKEGQPQQQQQQQQQSNGGTLNSPNASPIAKFTRDHWSDEVNRTTDESSMLWRLTMVDTLLIEHVILSVSLYRGQDSRRDPLRDRIGFLSSFIGSVHDARFDWRRVAEKNLCNKLWILVEYLRQDYQNQLQKQVLNLVHVAGLDTMRTIVNDLLDGYMGPRSVQADKVQSRLEPMRKNANFTADPKNGGRDNDFADFDQGDMDEGGTRTFLTMANGIVIARIRENEDLTHVRPFSGNFGAIAVGGATLFSAEECRCREIDREKRRGKLSTLQLRVEELAHHTTWNEFTALLPPIELRRFAPLALQQYIRSQAFGTTPAVPTLCNRCAEIEAMRRDRVANRSTCPLPPPDSGLITWNEYCHHASWQDFAYLATDEELVRYCNLLKDGIVGVPSGVRRIDASMQWAVDENVEERTEADEVG